MYVKGEIEASHTKIYFIIDVMTRHLFKMTNPPILLLEGMV